MSSSPIEVGLARLAQWTRAHTGLAIVAVATIILVWTGRTGIDFGHHWDEPVQFGLVNQTIQSGTLLPTGFYNYPSTTFLLSILAVGPSVVSRFGVGPPLAGDQFYVRARTLFLVVSTLAGVWIYGAVRRFTGEIVAGLAGAVLLVSWQFAYHARWIAPDAILLQFAALFLFVLVLAWDRPWSSRLVYVVFVVAGIAAATKYQGAVLLLPALVAVVAIARRDRVATRFLVRRSVLGVVVFLGTFLIITPGAVLQFREFLDDIRFESNHYMTSHGSFDGATPNDIASPPRYLFHLVRFVVLDLPSRNIAVSIVVMAVAMLGVVVVWRRDRLLTVAVLVAPVVLVVYFSMQHVFIVRNFLVLWPFLAFLFGLGLGAVTTMRRRWIGVVSIAMVAVFAIGGAWFLVDAADSIAAGPSVARDRLASEMRRQSSTTFAFTGPAASLYVAGGDRPPANAATTYAPGDSIVVTLDQLWHGGARLRIWPATGSGDFHVYGPDDVDFAYYPTWAGADRFIVLTPQQIDRFGVDVSSLGL